MTIKIGINGFGRIGRNVLRSAVQNFSDIEVVGINDLLEPDYLAYMLQYDSVHGRFKGTVSVEGNTLIVNGKKIRLTQERDPANLKWNEVGADVVIESTGLFLDKASARSTSPPAPRRSSCRPFQGRHPDVRLRREPQHLRRPGHHLQRLAAPPTAWPRGQGAERQVGHQARPDDHRARRHRHAEDRGRPVSNKDWRGGRGILENIIPSAAPALPRPWAW
jgi:glyceraldehyde 3-phosphate dehydrogenase